MDAWCQERGKVGLAPCRLLATGALAAIRKKNPQHPCQGVIARAEDRQPLYLAMSLRAFSGRTLMTLRAGLGLEHLFFLAALSEKASGS